MFSVPCVVLMHIVLQPSPSVIHVYIDIEREREKYIDRYIFYIYIYIHIYLYMLYIYIHIITSPRGVVGSRQLLDVVVQLPVYMYVYHY